MKYDFLNDNFTVYESVEEPKVTLNMPLFDSPLDISDWAEGVTPDGIPIVRSSEKPRMIIDNNPEEDYLNTPLTAPQTTPQTAPQTYNLSIDNLSGNEKKAMEFFMSKGLQKHLAAGLVGNLIRESRLNPRAKNPHGGAFGIALWLGSRKTKLLNKYGNNPTFEQQLEFVWEELNSTHRTGLLRLLNSNSIEEANDSAFGYYEFSSGVQGALRAMRESGLNGELSYRLGLEFARRLMN